MSSETVGVRLLDRDYLVACTAAERPQLLAAAQLLDAKLRDVKNSARSAAADRIAVLAALNLAHELLQLRASADREGGSVGAQLAVLRGKLDAALATMPK
ncbi:MAG: cell division protein ZapA [Lysobacterales bacterium]